MLTDAPCFEMHFFTYFVHVLIVLSNVSGLYYPILTGSRRLVTVIFSFVSLYMIMMKQKEMGILLKHYVLLSHYDHNARNFFKATHSRDVK